MAANQYEESNSLKQGLRTMKIGCCTFNSSVGNFGANLQRMLQFTLQAVDEGLDIIVFPELSLCGYPPKDMLFHPEFRTQGQQALGQLLKVLPPHIGVVIGAIMPSSDNPAKLENCALFLADGRVVHQQAKRFLANDDVFFEPRYFVSGESSALFSWRGWQLGLCVCQDLWEPAGYMPMAIADMAAQGHADLYISINASPYTFKKQAQRLQCLCLSVPSGSPVLYVNSYGSQDELFFDGSAMLMHPDGQVEQRGRFAEALVSFSLAQPQEVLGLIEQSVDAQLYQLIPLALADFVHKSGFTQVHLGLSGGIDSALVATLAVKALGAENVTGILMPSRYSSQHSVDDAEELARRLGINILMMAIDGPLNSVSEVCAEHFSIAGLTEENLQARIRGLYLMAYSNQHRSMLLTTGNKSELACGYGTLYGDMCGGYNPIGDLYKTQVYTLARHINAVNAAMPIPQNTIMKPPSAELRPNQRDDDSLPDYGKLDQFLEAMLEQGASLEQLEAVGLGKLETQRLYRLVSGQEFKRFQAPPVLKLSDKSFGSGRLWPLLEG